MSQVCPSSSHQLVAAAFRRARKKFPTNFGQLAWPIRYERKDTGKSVPVSSSSLTMTVCKNCEKRLPCDGEIRNSRSTNVWPSFPNTWKSVDLRGTRSLRENATSFAMKSSNDETTMTTGVCPCGRRICKSWKKRNFGVSFGEANERSNDGRACGGDVARSSIETLSRKSCQNRVTRDRCAVEKRSEDSNARETSDTRRTRRKRPKSEKKTRTKRYSCAPMESFQGFDKVDRLDLLYDRVDGTKNALSFSSVGREFEANASPEGARDFPSKLNEWEHRTQSFESEIERGRVVRRCEEGVPNNCDCARKINGQERNGSSRKEHRRSHKRDQRPPRVSSISQDLLPRSGESRASSFNGTNRLCKDCSLVGCPKNTSNTSSVRDSTVERQDERADRACHVEDSRAIKHKDSMALLVEKFKNKKILSQSDDETTIFKSDEDYSTNGSGTRIINEKKNERRKKFRASSSEDDEDRDVTRWKTPRNSEKSIFDTRKYYNTSKMNDRESRGVRLSGHCCSAKEK